jgi:Ni/Fe-hydrogenase subunit HybB-like protein
MKSNSDIKMWTPSTIVFSLFIVVGGIILAYRMFAGLGAVTNLNDRFPWGLWISMDVLGGVAMAAGGFLIAGTVYILNWKKYKPIVRAAILNAFFGYALAATAITLDIGIPWRIWHPTVMWQIHSVMWVVAIHVVLYTTTLATESSPMVFEKLKMPGAYRAVEKVMVPIVLFGVLLSILHQSSLGAVFLIASSKLSPLWYNGSLPTLFLLSAIMMGLSMVSLENYISGKAFGHEINMDIMSGLARGCMITAAIYLGAKTYFLASGPGLGAAFAGTMEANMFLLEMTIGVVVPLALLLMKSTREDSGRIFFVNILIIAGVLLNRLNVSFFGMYRDQAATGVSYFPSMMEFIVTIAFISMSIVGFKVCVKYLRVFPERG